MAKSPLDVLRYLGGIERRLDKLVEGAARDRDLMDRVHRLEERYRRLLGTLPPDRPAHEIGHIGWMLEELRVSFFAQMLGTAQPVSEKRVLQEMDRLARDG